MLDVTIRLAPGMRECYIEAKASLVRVVVLPAPLLAVQQYGMTIMSQLQTFTTATTDSGDSKQSQDDNVSANDDNSEQDATITGDHNTMLPHCTFVNVCCCEVVRKMGPVL
jgi:hypothetical protein